MKTNCSYDISLPAEEIPTHWYNFRVHLPSGMPPVRDEGPKGPPSEIMSQVRPEILLKQDKSEEPWIEIPNEVRERMVQMGRPTPLRRARCLERHLDTPAEIYFKREDLSPTGSFKLSTALAQAYYCHEAGYRKVVSETGAGQWGMALALASRFYNIDCSIFMSRCSLTQKPYRNMYMNLLGTPVSASPSSKTEIGRSLLAMHPNHDGSIGTAISDAIETALANPGSAYLSGSNVMHVLLHQTLLGLETRKQLIKVEAEPDELIACVSGGSNLCGFMMPFLAERLQGKDIRMLGVESSAAPRLTAGTYTYDRSDVAGYTPLLKGYSMGSDFIPAPVHVGGLRQHNSSPIVSFLRHEGLLDAVAYDEHKALSAGRTFLETEGILVAPESSHAVAATIDSALKAREEGRKRVIVFLCSGNGFLDMQGYSETLLEQNSTSSKRRETVSV